MPFFIVVAISASTFAVFLSVARSLSRHFKAVYILACVQRTANSHYQVICNKTRCCHPAKAFQLSATAWIEIHLVSSWCEPRNHWLCFMYSIQNEWRQWFPWWVISALYTHRLHLPDWSHAITTPPCTCQDSPEWSLDEWGWGKDSDVDVRRAAAWNERGFHNIAEG